MDSPPTSSGSPARRRSRDVPAAARRAFALASALILGAGASVAAQPKLLEPERAFALSVQAIDGRTLEVRYSIAEGYYLYREKLKFGVEPAALAAAPVLPPGKVKVDEFFGRVETYRGHLSVRLPLETAQPGKAVTVRAESQGCADAGVCYPPQAQYVTVRLPAPGMKPDAPVEATPTRKSWFN
jgi:thiol:disulfide interchange protein DsbD